MAIEYLPQTLTDELKTATQPPSHPGFFERFLNFAIPQDVLKQNNPALDGLRAIAALMVIIFHLLKYVSAQSVADPNISGAFSDALKKANPFWDIAAKGVPLFFLLSAFLLFQPYSQVIIKGDRKFPATSKFFKRRFLRVYPAYFVNLVLVLLIFTPQLLNPANWYVLILHLFMVFDASSSTIIAVNPSYWSLTVETRFYLLIPVIAFIIGRFLAKRKVLSLICFLGSFLITPFAIILYYVDGVAVVDYINLFLLISFLPVFFTGIGVSLVYTYLTQTKAGKLKLERWQKWINRYGILSLAALVVVPALSGAAVIDRIFYKIFEQNFLGFCFGGILLATLLGKKIWARILGHPFLRFIGIISYSLYLWHENLYIYVIVPLARSFKQEALVLPLSILLTVVISLPIAYFSYMLVERPFFKVRKSSLLISTPNEGETTPAGELVEVKN